MESKKHKVTITDDGRRKPDIILGKGGKIIANRDLVVYVEDEELENPCKANKLFMFKLKNESNEIV